MNDTCEICHGQDLLSLDEHFKGVDIVACKNCGLVWNRNMAEEPEQEEFYREHNRAGTRPTRRYLTSMLSRAACALEFLDGNLKGGMRHLDVGCAEGTLLGLTRSHGLEVQGLELDLNFSRFAREVRHLDVLPMTLEAAPLAPDSFDLISLVHVVEHLVHPVEILGIARQLLRSGGLLYVEVPNLQQPLPGLRHFFRPKHNFYFTANTLRAVASKAGFTPLRLGHSWRDASLQLLAVKSDAAETPSTQELARWRDDAVKIRAKIKRERNRHHLMLRLLFTHFIRKVRSRRAALRRYGPLLPEIAAAPR